MPPDVKTRVTEILRLPHTDDRMGALFTIVYNELRILAEKYLRQHAAPVTFQPTELVHEAFLKLVDQHSVSWQGKTHFYAVSAMVMKRVMIDILRHRKRLKRGGSLDRVALDDVLGRRGNNAMDLQMLTAIYEALEKLEKLDQREARVVELRIFGGLTVEEVAQFLNVSPRTVNSDWLHARAWLRRELSGGSPVL